MSREADVLGRSVAGGHRLTLAMLLLMMMALLSLVIATGTSAATTDVDLVWENPLPGLYVHEEVELTVQASGNVTKIKNLTFTPRRSLTACTS